MANSGGTHASNHRAQGPYGAGGHRPWRGLGLRGDAAARAQRAGHRHVPWRACGRPVPQPREPEEPADAGLVQGAGGVRRGDALAHRHPRRDGPPRGRAGALLGRSGARGRAFARRAHLLPETAGRREPVQTGDACRPAGRRARAGRSRAARQGDRRAARHQLLHALVGRPHAGLRHFRRRLGGRVAAADGHRQRQADRRADPACARVLRELVARQPPPRLQPGARIARRRARHRDLPRHHRVPAQGRPAGPPCPAAVRPAGRQGAGARAHRRGRYPVHARRPLHGGAHHRHHRARRQAVRGAGGALAQPHASRGGRSRRPPTRSPTCRCAATRSTCAATPARRAAA